MNQEFLTTEQLAEKLHISKKTLERLRTSGDGPMYTKVGRRVLYPADKLVNWLDEQTFNSTSEYAA